MKREEARESPDKEPAGALPVVPDTEDAIDPVWLVYFDGRPMQVSRSACGYSVEEWQSGGKEFVQRNFTPDSVERLRLATRTVRESGHALHNIEVEVRNKDGRRQHRFLVNYHPIFNESLQVVGMRGDARDITELRQLEFSHGHSTGLIASLIENSSDQFWVSYFDGRPGYASRSCCGYSRREWVSGGFDTCFSLVLDEDHKRLANAIEYVQTTGERVTSLQVRMHTKGSPRNLRFLMTLSPVFDAQGSVAGVQGMMHDITELTEVRAALERSERRFREQVETAHDLVWRVDRHGRWTYLNPAAASIYGGEPAELLGQSFIERTHPDHRERDQAAFERVLAGKELVQYETVHLRLDGSPRFLSFNIRPQLDENWEVDGAMGMARDVTDQKLYQEQLEHLADHDVMTGLFNRHYFERELEQATDAAARGQRMYGLLYIDLDNFKYVNDTLGHAAGDRLLLEVAQMLKGRLRQGDVLARFGGDEFTLLLQDMTPDRLRHVAQSFHTLFAGFAFLEAGRVFDIRISIGAVLIDAGTGKSGDALAQADFACGMAKTRGRNQAHLYDPADRALATMVEDIGWSRRLNEALQHDHFVLFYQPIVRLSDRKIEHYEVLLRLRENGERLIAPGAFLSQAERFGVIHAIDRWVVTHAIQELAAQHRQGRRLRFAINLSGRAFDDAELLPGIQRTLADTALDPAALTFEITETAAISHIAVAKLFIEQLKMLGCQFALDDFGSGFSSYSYLKFLSADYLKIDGTFVQKLSEDPLDQAIVQSMNQVAHALGKQTIAEFVEDEQTLELLRQYGVDYAQGYYLGRPGPLSDHEG